MILAHYRMARELRAARRDAAHYRESYDRMAVRLRDALTQLAGHDGCAERAAACERLQELLSLAELERDEARREVDEVRAALVWLERDFKVGGTA